MWYAVGIIGIGGIILFISIFNIRKDLVDKRTYIYSIIIGSCNILMGLIKLFYKGF